MATIDTSIVNISLPTIAHYFGVTLNGIVEWVVIAYLVAVAALLLTAGRLADALGHKPIWATGLAVFTVGSALCGAAPTLELLVIARALQGVGAALLMAISPAMLTGAFPRSQRGRALGLNAIIVSLGVSIGPTLGGLLTQYFTWRSIFYVNLPLGIIGFVATLLLLPKREHRTRGRFDPLGALLVGVGLAGLTLALSFGQEWGWTSPLLIGVLAVALVALGGLILVERRVAHPVVNFSLLGNRVFSSAIASLVLNFLALFAVSFLLPFYFEELRGFSTQEAGLLLTPLPLTIAVMAPISGALADRWRSTRWLAAGGMTLACSGLVLLSQLNAHSSVWDIVWRLVVTGAGQGLFQAPNNSALLGAAPRDQQGAASGFLATGRVVGQSLSVALAGAVFAAFGGAAAGLVLAQHPGGEGLPAEQTLALQQTFLHGFEAAYLVCAAIAAVGVFTSLVRGRERAGTAHTPS
jgi:EmrB/QacA subfamily drug resistance transporter